MMRRAFASSTRRVAHQTRLVATGHNAIAIPGAPQPPMIPEDPVHPMDFSPHIEWYEYPREVWDPKWPYTRDECLRMQDERWDYTADELADKYGMKVMSPPKIPFWAAWLISGCYVLYNAWSCYRASPDHPSWPQYRIAIMQAPDCPTVGDDEIYLDTWINPGFRQRHGKVDLFWAWKPLVKKDGAENPWAIELERKDPAEWKHMLGK